MPGPRPTPTAILEARGSWRAKKRGGEPRPEVASPLADPPAWLNGAPGRMWARLAPTLASMGVLTTADEDILARYCSMSVRWLALEAFLRRHGHAYKTTSREGGTRWCAYPQSAISKQLAGELVKLERELGLTPSARVGLEVPEAPQPLTEVDDGSADILSVG